MGLTSKAWATFQGLEIVSSGVLGGKLYFGTADGKVCLSTGYIDGVGLDGDTGSASPVKWSVITAFQNFGNPNRKRMTLMRPIFVADVAQPLYDVEARYDLDLTPLDATVTEGGISSRYARWDVNYWDDGSIWAEAGTEDRGFTGASGMGANMAIAIHGESSSRDSLVGFDAMWMQGGVL
jgi:hypothetical protein